MRQLDIPAMINPILANYNTHVDHFMQFLKNRIQCRLIYEGPQDIQQHILQKTTYACSVYCQSKKIIKDVFPIMIGSDLDLAIRHGNMSSFESPLSVSPNPPFQKLDIGRGFFMIAGSLRHLPYFFTNDPTNTHMKQNKIVRVYTYDSLDRGKELNYYVADADDQIYGDVVISHNDGTRTSKDDHFFHHCPLTTHPTAYMAHLHRENMFDIDHLGNKMVVSPGHLFVKLFIKHFYESILLQNWSKIKSKMLIVKKYIEMGDLLHVLSEKTSFHKEGKTVGLDSHREIGANGEVFVEKSIGCYREVNMQTYPFNPYMLFMIVRQTSKRVKKYVLKAFHSSYVGFFCTSGCFETKNVGRTMMMVRDTVVSTCVALDPVFQEDLSPFWQSLNLQVSTKSGYYVVVNEACIPVTKSCFDCLDLLKLKRRWGTLECYQRGNFIIIRYKVGLIMKPLHNTDIWVTPYDEMFWVWRLWGLRTQEFRTMDSITSYLVDLNPFFCHNGSPRNMLGFNALKNAILATDPSYAHYFMDTVSAYLPAPTQYHRKVLEPVADGISHHFALWIPHVTVTYASFLGYTQEDCIVQRKDVDAFNCYRFYTLRFKVQGNGFIRFYPVQEDLEDLLGTVVSDQPLTIEPFSIHVKVIQVSPKEYHLRFSKTPFRVVQHFISNDKLTVSVEQEHISNTGDKLCSFHGQKGVICVVDKVLTLDETVQPDLIINPYSLFRMTPGQLIEALQLGGAKDAKTVRNSEGELIPGATALYGKTFYFPIAYWSFEHLYAPKKCTMDKVMGQPVKGRSRGGGMRLGNMELFNVMRGNGLAACFEQKFFEDGDRVLEGSTLAIPKSVNLVQEDARFYKCNLQYASQSSVLEISKQTFSEK